MKGAVTGVGVIGSVHAQILKKRGELCAVCDIDEKRREKYADIPSYPDYIKMLDEARPDVVHICTPHYLHAGMICEALARGINVLCEKPLCISNEQIDMILEAEKKSKAKLGVCLQNRYNPENRFVKEYLADKTVKCVTGCVTWHRDAAYYGSAEWRGKYSTEGGGVLINQALHTLDLSIWFAGVPETVISDISNLTLKDKIEVEDTAVILGRGKSSINFFATNGSSYDMPVELTVKTENEIIKVLPGCVVINGEVKRFENKYEALGKKCYGSGHEALIEDFYECVKENRPFETDGEEASKVVKVILAAYKSRGASVTVE